TFFLEGMDAANQVDQIPPPEFHEYVKDPLIELSPTDSKELWLIQWPMNQLSLFSSLLDLFLALQAPDFDGQELTLKLHHDGLLGSFEGSSGKY
ncbi:hypothetical protein C3L33_13289, partial [Rhododendron williamsianum]